MEKKKVKLKRVTKKITSPKPEVKKKALTEAVVSGVSDEAGLYNLRVPKGAHKPRKIKGRGPSSGHGKTSTRGSKGQTSRAGRHFYLGFEGGQSPLIRRMPKRGFTNIFKKVYQIVNLRDLNKIKETTNINLALLEEKGLIKDKAKLVKILGDGEIRSSITVQAHAFSKKAASIIQGAGGKAEVVIPPVLLSQENRGD